MEWNIHHWQLLVIWIPLSIQTACVDFSFKVTRHFSEAEYILSIKYVSPSVTCGPDSSIGIATGYGLDSPRILSRWGARFSAPVQTGPGAHPASCTMGTGSSPGVKSGRGVTLTPHPLLVPWSWKGTAIPLLPLWAVRTVQSLSTCTRVLRLVESLSACTRVHFTLFFTFCPSVRY